MPIGDRSVWVSRPRVSYDDVDGIQLDEKESWEGIKTEVTALDSLQVGVLRSRAEIDQYQKEHSGCRVIKSLGFNSEGAWSSQDAPCGKELCSRKAFCP